MINYKYNFIWWLGPSLDESIRSDAVLVPKP